MKEGKSSDEGEGGGALDLSDEKPNINDSH